MRHRLQRQWHIPAVWLSCFAVLFGKDAASLSFDKFDLFALLEAFGSTKRVEVVYPEILPVIMALLREGLLSLVRQEPDAASPKPEQGFAGTQRRIAPTKDSPSRQRSLTVNSQSQNSRKTATPWATIFILTVNSSRIANREGARR